MRTIPTLALAAALSLGAGTAQAQMRHRHETQADLRREARVTEAAARATALAQVPHGRVKSEELEREHGKLIYSYDIQVPGHRGIEEVNVDAITGAVVSRQHEGARDERAEARAEAKEKAAGNPRP